MKKLSLALIAVCAVMSSGCGSVIFKSGFSGSGNPQGQPSGAPSGDHITVNNPVNSSLNGGELVFQPSGGSTFFFSRSVKKADTTKTLFWKGQLKSGDGPFTFLISAENSVGTPFLTNPIELRLSDDQAQMIGLPPDNTVLHSHALNKNGPHQIFVSLRLKTETYRITFQQPGGTPEFEFTGSLDPLTVNRLKSHSRITMQAGFCLSRARTNTLWTT